MTGLYLYDRAGEDPIPESAAARLPSWRRERYDRLRRPEARQEALIAGLLYRCAMGRRGLEPDAEVRLLPAGKPVREDGFFSLSHSGRYVLCAVSDGPVGADVQERRSVRDGLSRFFHPAEQARLASRPEELFRVWTRKEAWVKAVSAERTLSLAEADVLDTVPGLSFRDYELPGGYAAALCGADPDLPDPTPVTRAELMKP